MIDKDTPVALCPRCESPDLVAVTLAFHAITEDLGVKGVFRGMESGDDYHLECSDCGWSDGTWGLTLHSEATVSMEDLKYATFSQAKELAEIKEQFRQERDGAGS